MGRLLGVSAILLQGDLIKTNVRLIAVNAGTTEEQGQLIGIGRHELAWLVKMEDIPSKVIVLGPSLVYPDLVSARSPRPNLVLASPQPVPYRLTSAHNNNNCHKAESIK